MSVLPFKYKEIRTAMPRAPAASVGTLWLALNGLIVCVLAGAVAGVFYLLGFNALWLVKLFGLACVVCSVLIMGVVRVNRYLADRNRTGRPG